MFKNPFSFEGRIRRTEYGLSIIIYIGGILLMGAIDSMVVIGSFIYLTYLPLLWFYIAQGAKRCHDRGNSAWFLLIPFYGLWMLFANSDYGPNMYGPNPKGQGNFDEEINDIGNYIVRQ